MLGEGYIIIDPSTGSGAYKISGGDDGGILCALDKGLEKLIGVLSSAKDSLGSSLSLLKPVSKLLAQMIRLLKNVRNIIAIIQACNVGGALLGAILFTGLILVLTAATMAIYSALGLLCFAVSGGLAPTCILLGSVLLMPIVLGFVNKHTEDAIGHILSGMVCTAGT